MVVLSLLLLGLVRAPAETPAPCFCRVTVQEVIDGDTFTGEVQLPFGVTLRRQTFRIRDFDAWETSKRRKTVHVTDAEIEKGKVATSALRKLLHHADAVYVSGELEPERTYNRLLVKVWVDEPGEPPKLTNVAERMRELGHERHE